MTWAEYMWPDWVPLHLRERVMAAWKPDPNYARGGGKTEAAGWLSNTRNNGAPELGTRVVARRAIKSGKVRGRYVHGWNNLGFVLTDDLAVEFVGSDGAKPDAHVEWMP